ncbi:tetratricopeptide repeat protein [Absicoccus porci]|uniref:tetratricopeptide repeat protein n=1 Tax=Absicoccus porci TaxID=2486576 RepID=UPI002A82C504|nr:tetratricopeptide repeat protein [Absicoccus porci]MDY4739377.1 tetratricopeptide repeat protein [Absicoccus porci]
MGLFNFFKKPRKNKDDGRPNLPSIPSKAKSHDDISITVNVDVDDNDDSYDEKELIKFQKYWNESNQITNEYFDLLERIKRDWSTMYNLHDYTGQIATNLETNCKRSIELFNKWKKVSIKYDQDMPPGAPCYKRLAMLYEKQKKYEESIDVCKEAIHIGVNISDAKPRMVRMIKKAKREPTDEEMKLIESD